MSSCRVTRARLLDLVRGTASDASLLEVESHLEDCEACRLERSRLGLLGWLKEQPAPALSASANRRVLARLVEAPPGDSSRRGRAASRRRPWLLAGATFALSMVALIFSLRGRGPVETLTESRQIDAAAPGVVAFGGARVLYSPGTKMLAEPARRRLGLSRGEVDVDVDPRAGLPGHFRVVTDSFVVEVVGTRFIVTPGGVRTLRGLVRVLDLTDRELAVVEAGESWSAPRPVEGVTTAAPVPAPAPVLPPIAPPPVERTIPAPARARAAASVRRDRVGELLARGRSAMSDGDADEARVWISRARTAGPTEDEAAALDLLEADAWLVTKQPDTAIAAYRRVASRWSGTAQAETATFAVGQLLVEGGSPAAAETALDEYLARYPHGRFVREAREQLALVQASK
jgi:hypothetical protein